MKFRLHIAAVLLCNICMWGQSLTSQTSTADTQTARDPQIASALNASVVAMGGIGLAQVSDSVAQVEVTNADTGNVVPMTVKVGSPDQVRIVTPDANKSFVSNGVVANVTSEDGKTEVFSTRAFGPEGLRFLPAIAIARDIADPATKIEAVADTPPGTVKFHVRRPLKPPVATAREYDFTIDTKTGVIASITFRRFAPSDEKFSILVEHRFGRYELHGGVLVPMEIAEYIRGKHVSTTRIVSIAFNQGLSSADFAVRSTK